MSAIYTATFSAVAVSAAQDVFEIVAPSTNRVAIRFISLGQYSEFGDAQAELLSVLLIRGYTTSGSGGTSVTPSNINGWSAARSAGATVEANNTTIAADGSPKTLIAESWNVAGGWKFYPVPEERPVLEASQRLVCRITAPTDAVTLNGTIVFEELPKPAA